VFQRCESCYDRIVHSVASMVLQRLGVPKEPIVSMFGTIQALRHHIQTIHGVSEAYSTSTTTGLLIQGVGQGNGAGPQIWAAISSVVLNMLRAEQCGSFFTSAISGESLDFVGYAFVDDVDLVSSAQNCDSTYAFQNIQKALNIWEGGITASGGAIVPEKSHWYLVDFAWKNGQASYRSIQDSPASIWVKDCHGRQQCLHWLESHQAERTLGVRLAPDGNMQAQYQALINTATEWSVKLSAGHLSRSLVQQALLTTVMKTLTYCLPATTFTSKQCDNIL
jgi:hypothetical protein